jgi:hypothetical protein
MWNTELCGQVVADDGDRCLRSKHRIFFRPHIFPKCEISDRRGNFFYLDEIEVTERICLLETLKPRHCTVKINSCRENHRLDEESLIGVKFQSCWPVGKTFSLKKFIRNFVFSKRWENFGSARLIMCFLSPFGPDILPIRMRQCDHIEAAKFMSKFIQRDKKLDCLSWADCGARRGEFHTVLRTNPRHKIPKTTTFHSQRDKLTLSSNLLPFALKIAWTARLST